MVAYGDAQARGDPQRQGEGQVLPVETIAVHIERNQDQAQQGQDWVFPRMRREFRGHAESTLELCGFTTQREGVKVAFCWTLARQEDPLAPCSAASSQAQRAGMVDPAGSTCCSPGEEDELGASLSRARASAAESLSSPPTSRSFRKRRGAPTLTLRSALYLVNTYDSCSSSQSPLCDDAGLQAGRGLHRAAS